VGVKISHHHYRMRQLTFSDGEEQQQSRGLMHAGEQFEFK
jgi:hypothetical protein